MTKQMLFSFNEAVSYFYKVERTENEEYLLNLILQLGKEYNALVDNHNKLVCENQALIRRLSLNSHYVRK